MQPMRLCIHSGMQFGKTFENSQQKKSNKCKQCDYASYQADNLRRHLKTHSGEKSNKCNQCDFASAWAGHLRRHYKTHSGERTNKCNQCDYASSRADSLRTHLKFTALVISQTTVTSVIIHPLMQTI